MDLSLFTDASPGVLVSIDGTDPRQGEWRHKAFVPHPLSNEAPPLSPGTHRAVANARAALATLDSTASHLPNPRLLRRPTLQAEAQSTSALEGTYAPLAAVLTADEERPPSSDLREILNYVAMATYAFSALEEGRHLSVSLLEQLQAMLVDGTRHHTASSGSLRDIQVVIGRRSDFNPSMLPIEYSRFVPAPPGLDLQAMMTDLVGWMGDDHTQAIDPVVSAAVAHYQFETLHPFHDGNGRIGRLLIVVSLLQQRVLSEPTLSVSPWFESRRSEYYDHLLAVSTDNDWDGYVRFFATGLEASAHQTLNKMLALSATQTKMKEIVRTSRLRADTAQALVDFAVGHTTFTVRAVERELSVSYGRANGLIGQLCSLKILRELESSGSTRRFYAPGVLEVLLQP